MSIDNDRDMMLGGINSNYIEKKFEIVLNHSLGQGDTEAILTYKIPSQQIENRNIGCRIETTRSNRHLESMELLSEELNLRLSQVTDSLMNFLQVQITRAINSAINDKMVPEIQNIMGTLSSGRRDTDAGSSPNNQDNTEGTNGFISKITKKDSRSACNLRDTDDRSPYMGLKGSLFFFGFMRLLVKGFHEIVFLMLPVRGNAVSESPLYPFVWFAELKN